MYFVAWVVWGGGRIARGCGFEGCEGDGCCCGGWAGFGGGGLDLPLEGTLNGVFPELGTLKVEEAVRVWVSREMSRSV